MSDDIIQDAIELCGLPPGHAADDVIHALAQFLRANHPDRFRDAEAKSEATQRFKKAGDLLSKLRIEVERSEAGISTTAIQLSSPQAQRARSELEFYRLSQENLDAADNLRHAVIMREGAERERDEAKTELSRKRETSIEEARQRITAFKPSGTTIASVGITGVLVVLYAVVGQLDTLASKILRPLGLGPRTAGAVIFGVFGVAVVLTFHGYLRARMLARAAARISTTASLQRFAKKISDRDRVGGRIEFTEQDVVEFVAFRLIVTGRVGRALRLLLLDRVSEEDVDRLKDLLIAQMLQHGLIEAGPINSLQRVFRTRERGSTSKWTDHEDWLN